MRPGRKFVGAAAMLSVAACGGQQGKLQIRPSPTPLAAGHVAVPVRIAEARGQFALGNVALALESFRIALRENPSNVDAMTGVAACYDRMARFDLSRRHYESALAIAPGDPQLLAAFAASLDLQGRKAESASVWAEINQRLALAARQSLPRPAPAPTLASDAVEVAATPPSAVAVPASLAPPVPRPVSVERAPAPLSIADLTAKPSQTAGPVPAPNPAPRATVTAATSRSVTVALPPARPVAVAQAFPAQPVETVAAPPLSRARPVQSAAEAPVQIAAVASPVRPVAPAPLVAPTVESSVGLALPAAPVAAPVARPVIEFPAEIAQAGLDAAAVPVEKTGPRLERTSLREMALITTGAPQWRALTAKSTQRSATVRFVPLRQASINLSNIRLLNAARTDRLAARTRSYLVGRGWSPMAIGDAPAVRAHSVIFYPPERRRTAQRLSAQFGFVMTPRPGSRQITVLLGRDAARVPALRASA